MTRPRDTQGAVWPWPIMAPPGNGPILLLCNEESATRRGGGRSLNGGGLGGVARVGVGRLDTRPEQE